MSAATVTIRMYNPGFGDCFLLTVRRDDAVWRMLVDCGVHSHGRFKTNGQSRPIGDIVSAVIAQLSAESADGSPHLDVVVATHRHADHISGFADEAWKLVSVGEVWVPFVEDSDDPDTKALKGDLNEVAEQLEALVSRALTARPHSPALGLAREFAVNSSGNALATRRLLTGDFANAGEAHVRYLPYIDETRNVIPTPLEGVRVHVLGPPRSAELLKKMNPPKEVQWLKDADSEALSDSHREALFDSIYHVLDGEIEARISPDSIRARNSMRLNALAFDEEALLSAASILERSVNNTSVFFVLEVLDLRFVFVGDSQQGGWSHVLDDPVARGLVTNATFYKVGHHGSHNSTPRRFVEETLGENATAMIPVGHVKAWADSIPNAHLMEGLARRNTRIIRADVAPTDPDVVTDDVTHLWSEISFSAGE